MTTLQVNARLPLAETPAQQSLSGGRKQGDDSRAQAWRREMERAQLDGWLSHGVLGRHTVPAAAQVSLVAPKVPVSPPIPPGRAAARHVVPPPAVAFPARPAAPVPTGESSSVDGATGAPKSAPSSFNSAGLRKALQRFGVIEAVTAVHSSLGPEFSFSLQARSTVGLGPSARPVKVPAAAATDAPVQPIRVHAEWTEDGVRLWLGMDAGALSALDQITLQLQAWLGAQGLRLRSLSCNGQVLCPEATSSQSADDVFSFAELAGLPVPHLAQKEFP